MDHGRLGPGEPTTQRMKPPEPWRSLSHIRSKKSRLYEFQHVKHSKNETEAKKRTEIISKMKELPFQIPRKANCTTEPLCQS